MPATPLAVRPPQQPRSEATLKRIGDAAVTLLQNHSLEEISVNDICRWARTSVGSFYARFADKNALLVWIEENYAVQSRNTMANILDPDHWTGKSLTEIIHGLMHAYVRFLCRHRAVLRALALESRLHPEGATNARSRILNLASYQRTISLLLTRREEIHSPDPRATAEFGLTAVYATSHELILFGDSGLHPTKLSDNRIADMLAALYLGILRPQRS